MANVKGINVTGDLIAGNPDKTFFVAGSPTYEQIADLRDATKTKEKLIVPIVLMEDGPVMDYYPNKTSIKQMTVQYGWNMDDWVGHKFEWGVADQSVAGQMKKVLFVMPKRFNDILPKIST